MARDIYHQVVRTALEKEGWIVTHDPFIIPKKKIGAKLEIDLGLERVIIAEKDTEKIVVEVKSFLKNSLIHEFHGVLGQYLNYEIGLEKINSDRLLFLAMPENTFKELCEMPLFHASVEKFVIKIIVFEPKEATITLWKR
jgi:XisH protein